MKLEAFVHDSGESVPVVLLHAFPLNGKMWSATVERLQREGFRVIAPNLPGFDGSDGSIRSLSDAAGRVIAYLEENSIDVAIFCGISMGGYVLFEIIDKRPEIVKRAVFCDTTSEADTIEKQNSRRELVKTIEKDGLNTFLTDFPQALVSTFTLQNRSNVMAFIDGLCREATPEAVCAALRAMAVRRNFTEKVSQIRCPVMFVYGAADFALDDGKMMHGLLPGSELQVIADAGHYSAIESPDAFNNILIDFLKQDTA